MRQDRNDAEFMSLTTKSVLTQAVSHGHAAADTGIELAQEVLANFGQLRLGVTGGSMLPAIVPGDVLSFASRPTRSLVPGQVILTRYHGKLIAHRLVACRPDTLLTQGDSLPNADLPVSPSNVLGVMVRHERGPRELSAGEHHLGIRPTIARWVLRRSSMARRVCLRWPGLAGLMA